jgi:hypothetical protein
MRLMMMRRFPWLFLGCLVVLTLVASSCGETIPVGGEQEEEEEEGEQEEEYGEQEEEEDWVGRLPIYQVGDKWGWRYVVDDITTLRTEEIIAAELVEDRDCYVVSVSFNPPISYTQDNIKGIITSMTYWLDKATIFYRVKMELSVASNEKDYDITEIYSYDSWLSIFPLEIGEGVEMEKETSRYLDSIQTAESIITTEKYFTHSKEDITVAAGEFNCWKILVYNGNDNTVQTLWYSDRFTTQVRITDVSGSLMELESYLVK